MLFRAPKKSSTGDRLVFKTEDVVWALGSFCALNQRRFDAELLVRQSPPPYDSDSIIEAARSLGFRIKRRMVRAEAVAALGFPCLVVLLEPASDGAQKGPEAISDASSGPVCHRPALAVQAEGDRIVLFRAGTNTPASFTLTEFRDVYVGTAFQLSLRTAPPPNPNPDDRAPPAFGFRWFIPELLKHRHVWRDVLVASLVIQLLALATPLFTQVVIDKVVVHRTQSTLLVLGIGLGVFMIFSALLSWVRQYLVIHTGNRVDAVLGAAVFEHLFKLPPRYFEHRPTGVISARLRGVDEIREFIAGTAVSVALDLPFLLVFVAIMFAYSVSLTLITLAIVGCIAGLTLVTAPLFRARLNDQFLLGARNQAFTTEYIAGMETVKSLQMEPQLKIRYGDYLAQYLRSGFRVRQVANTYTVISNLLEQLMTLLILVIGAYTVMTTPDFSIGMLVAFQMFAGRVSQPLLRLVGLWQQFQQASLSVARLGDIMNAPTEPYSAIPNRTKQGTGHIAIQGLAFRYAENLPYLFEGFDLDVQPGATIAIMGASGSGKSTLAKLLLGFYQPGGGTIKLDGNDIRHLSANELRDHFGVVPQDTVLFSGTIYDNLRASNPLATFDQIAEACQMAEIHDVIDRLPNGYETEIGERGVGLSGGQRQRIAIARALLKKPKVLIFDEATSSLDPETARLFALTVNRLRGKVSLLFIAHALPPELNVDAVINIGSGPSLRHLALGVSVEGKDAAVCGTR
jgi:subfamily B ATP-binding cassette protein HlyB/CyaB